jgi:hypothetical protein
LTDNLTKRTWIYGIEKVSAERKPSFTGVIAAGTAPSYIDTESNPIEGFKIKFKT